MTALQRLQEISKDMDEGMLGELVNFAEYIKSKKTKNQLDIVDAFMDKYNEALEELSK